jgi:hypothetical protein
VYAEEERAQRENQLSNSLVALSVNTLENNRWSVAQKQVSTLFACANFNLSLVWSAAIDAV